MPAMVFPFTTELVALDILDIVEAASAANISPFYSSCFKVETIAFRRSDLSVPLVV